MVKTFYLVRHGLKENLAGDPPLSKLRVKQAETTADYFSTLSVNQTPNLFLK